MSEAMETTEAVPHARSSLEAERRTALARSIRVLRMLEAKGAEAFLTGSLASSKFTMSSDVDFILVRFPESIRYGVEARVEDIMGRFEFDVVYADEISDALRSSMLSKALSLGDITAGLDARTCPKLCQP
jgi:predicted nucleotidyltransferase